MTCKFDPAAPFEMPRQAMTTDNRAPPGAATAEALTAALLEANTRADGWKKSAETWKALALKNEDRADELARPSSMPVQGEAFSTALKAAEQAYFKHESDNGAFEAGVKAAIEAYLALSSPLQGREPDEWQVRIRFNDRWGDWSRPSLDPREEWKKSADNNPDRIQYRELFALSAPQPVGSVQVGLDAEIRAQAEIIDAVVNRVEIRCMATDGPVTPTLREITEKEMSEIWQACNAIITHKKAASAPAPEEWQPIETAPKEGTDIWLWSAMWEMSWGVCTGRYEDGQWFTSEGIVNENEPGFDPEAEIEGVDPDDFGPFDSDTNMGPTHWQPLHVPAPPQGEQR